MFSRRVADDRTGERIAVLNHGTVYVIDAETAQEQHRVDVDIDENVLGDWPRLALAPDGAHIAVALGPSVAVYHVASASQCWSREVGGTSRHSPRENELLFSRDGSRAAARMADDAWYVWDLEGRQLDRQTDGAIPRALEDTPAGWTVQTEGPASVFTHLPSRVQLAVPVEGPWCANPARDDVWATADVHLRLCRPENDETGTPER